MFTPKIRDEKDEIVTSRKGNADTFATYYSSLYAKEKNDEDEKIDEEGTPMSHKELDVNEDQTKRLSGNPEEVDERENRMDRSGHIPEFTKQEPQTATDGLKKRKSGDTKGIKAEDIKRMRR